jgi:hypothetical protein
VEEFPSDVNGPPRRNEPGAPAAPVAETLFVALLVQQQIIFRNAAVFEWKTAQGTPETADVPIVVAEFDRIAACTSIASRANTGRNFGDAPQCADGSVLRH